MLIMINNMTSRVCRRILSCLVVLLLSAPLLHASDKRGKIIDFEDDVVEGLNRRPLDSLNQISEAERRRRKTHLYHKRAGFRFENAETLRTVRYVP